MIRQILSTHRKQHARPRGHGIELVEWLENQRYGDQKGGGKCLRQLADIVSFTEVQW